MMIEYATLREKIDWQSTRVLLNTYNQIKLRMKEQEVEAVSPLKKLQSFASSGLIFKTSSIKSLVTFI